MPRYTLDGDRRKSPLRFLRIFLEIPVIVFSIYIAFLVDEWDKNKTLAITEKKYLRELLAEVKQNRAELRADQDERREQIVLLEAMLENSIRPVDPDTLRLAMDQLLNMRIFSPTDAVYEDLISSGNLNLLSSDSLRSELIEYRGRLSRTPITEKSDLDVIEKQIQPYLIQKQVFSLLEPYADVKGIAISEDQKDRIIRVLLNDRTFIDLVYLRRHSIGQVLWFETPMQWNLRNMQAILEDELDADE